jgi:hypothetical protein
MVTLALIAPALLNAAITIQPLSPLEEARGFKLYSGENATTLWHGFKKPGFPTQGWKVENGELSQFPPGGGDIVTNDQFTDFELSLQFKLAPKANSGIMWRVLDKHDATWHTGPEYQLLDDQGHTGLNPGQACGSIYDLYPASPDKPTKPAGDWSTARIYMRNGVVQHWLNGAKVAQATIADDSGRPTKEWLDKIAAAKFKSYPDFGVQPKGSIALQDHGGGVTFKDIQIRDLASPAPRELKLMPATDAASGKDIAGWKCIVPDLAAKNEDQGAPWSIEDGILICSGKPGGYIRTNDKYTNYILKLEWRFNPVTKEAGNSGVLLRMHGEDKVWPKSVEAQLHSGNAGDFWNIDNFTMTADPARTKGRNTKKTHAAERPIGEWNEYEIIVNKGDIILLVNGEELNRASEVEEVPGHICLQSEGAEIHFLNIRLIPLD